VPAFVPVPLRSRRDGWTPRRQADFLGYLAETQSVAAAARSVNMARETAYRLRERPGAESFAAAWDVALGKAKAPRHPSRKVTGDALWHRALWGTLQPRMHAGKYVGTSRKTDVSALLRVIRNPAAAAGEGFGRSRISWDDPCKHLGPDPAAEIATSAGSAAGWWPRADDGRKRR